MTQNLAEVIDASPHQLAPDVLEWLWFGDDDPERTALDASRSMTASAATAAGLKPFPAVATQVLALSRDPRTPASALRDVVEADPALAGQLLRVANSSAYRGRQEIRDVREAIVRLGSRQVVEIVVGVTALGLFEDTQGFGRIVRDHSAGVAAIARVLADEWFAGRVNNVFVSGLVHDLGKLLAIQVREIPYEQLHPSALSTYDLVHIHERMLVGWDHAVLGAHVMKRWGLPPDLVDVIGLHHQPGRAQELGGETGVAVSLLRIADRIEYQLRSSTELDGPFLRWMSRDGNMSYVGFQSDMLKLVWSDLVTAWRDSQAMFRG